jgi:hypothetical protein
MFNLSVLSRAGMNRDAQVAVKELRRLVPELESHQVERVYYTACARKVWKKLKRMRMMSLARARK